MLSHKTHNMTYQHERRNIHMNSLQQHKCKANWFHFSPFIIFGIQKGDLMSSFRRVRWKYFYNFHRESELDSGSPSFYPTQTDNLVGERSYLTCSPTSSSSPVQQCTPSPLLKLPKKKHSSRESCEIHWQCCAWVLCIPMVRPDLSEGCGPQLVGF